MRDAAVRLAMVAWVLVAAVPVLAASHHWRWALYAAGYAALLAFVSIAHSLATRARDDGQGFPLSRRRGL